MERWRVPRFARDLLGLDRVRLEAKQLACPHCGRHQTLVGHGLVRGYCARTSERIVRGRRLLCSNRYRRPGCGRTVMILLATMLVRRVVDAAALAALWRAIAQARAPTTASDVPLAPRSRARLARRLEHAQHQLRTSLLAAGPVPKSDARTPLSQLWQHLRRVVGHAPCPVANFQQQFERHALGF